ERVVSEPAIELIVASQSDYLVVRVRARQDIVALGAGDRRRNYCFDIPVAQYRPVTEYETLDVGRCARLQPGADRQLRGRAGHADDEATGVARDDQVPGRDISGENDRVHVTGALKLLDQRIVPARSAEVIRVASRPALHPVVAAVPVQNVVAFCADKGVVAEAPVQD